MNLLLFPSFATFLALLTLTVVLLYKYVTSTFDYWKKRDIPYVKPRFPFGNFLEVVSLKSSIGEFLKNIYIQSNEDLMGFWIFRTPHLLIRSPEIIKDILVKDFNSFTDRTVVSDEKADPIGSKLLLNLKSPEWKLMRAKVSPIFTSSKLKQMTALVDKAGEDFNKYLKASNGGILEVKEICAKYTTDVVTSCAFGVDAHSFHDDEAPFRVAGRRLLGITFINGVRFVSYFMVPTLVKVFRIAFFDPVAIGFLKNAFWDTIKAREESKAKRNDLIDIIIKLKKEVNIGDGIKFEGERVVAQAIQFYIAGFETTSSTISYILYEMALNKKVQQIARDEIKETLEEHGNFGYDVLLNMKYLDKVIAETLRKYPSLPFLDRRCMVDYKVPKLGVVIPKGTPVYIPMLGIHYDPQYYPDPQKFDPERFSEEGVKSRPAFTHMPFGHGPHNCIGERFAMIATKLALVHILRDFEVETCSQTPIPLVFNPGTFILQIYGGLPMRFTRIT